MRVATLLTLALLLSLSSCRGRSACEPCEELSRRSARGGPASALFVNGELRFGESIFVRIFKHERELELWTLRGAHYELARVYPICRFSGALGPKLRQGDRQSPEGFYFVRQGQLNPNSRYHLSFNIGYPNAYDRSLGRTGSAIMVHGGCASIGCFAMTDEVIEEIYAMAESALRGGQPFFRVHVFPFRMHSTNMVRFRGSRADEFWENLKEGYDVFERDRRPPNVLVEQQRYVFEGS